MELASDEPERTVVLPDTPPFTEAAVCAWFGVAASAAQAFELSLANFAIVVELAETPGVIPPKLRGNPFKVIERATMGQVLNRARRVVSFHPDLVAALNDAISARNRLFHHFFSSNRERMESEAGREELVSQLRTVTQTFFDLGNAVNDLAVPIMRVLALSPDQIEAEVQKWTAEDT